MSLVMQSYVYSADWREMNPYEMEPYQFCDLSITKR